MLDTAAGWLVAGGIGVLGGFTMRSFIRDGRKERTFQRRSALIGLAMFTLGMIVAIIDAVINDKPIL